MMDRHTMLQVLVVVSAACKGSCLAFVDVAAMLLHGGSRTKLLHPASICRYITLTCDAYIVFCNSVKCYGVNVTHNT